MLLSGLLFPLPDMHIGDQNVPHHRAIPGVLNIPDDVDIPAPVCLARARARAKRISNTRS